MLRPLPIALLLAISLAALGCGGAPPAQPPGQPPTPTSITRANPGGDADDPERAALERLLAEPWGNRRDRFNSLHVPLADWKKWRRVRIWNHPTRATYRYGDDHYAVATILYTPIDGPNDPDTCLADFWQKASPLADAYGVRLGESQIFRTTQDVDGETRPLVLKLLDGSLESVFSSDEYVGAVAVYQSWPDTCLVHAFAVKSGAHRDLALKVRERWISEGAPKLRWLPKITEAPETKAR
jgi:hypothetical protein